MDATPVVVEMAEVAEVEAKDEVCCASKSNPTFEWNKWRRVHL